MVCLVSLSASYCHFFIHLFTPLVRESKCCFLNVPLIMKGNKLFPIKETFFLFGSLYEELCVCQGNVDQRDSTDATAPSVDVCMVDHGVVF